MSYQDSINARKQQYIDNRAARRDAASQIVADNVNEWTNNTASSMRGYVGDAWNQGKQNVQAGMGKIRAKVPEPRATEMINSILGSSEFKDNVMDYGKNVASGARSVLNQSIGTAAANINSAKQRVRDDIIAKGQARYAANPELFDRILNSRGY